MVEKMREPPAMARATKRLDDASTLCKVAKTRGP
jgi:hypothetical protein